MSKSFYDLLSEQIGHEFAASHQYLSMAIWLDGSVQAGPRPQGRDPRCSRCQERLRERSGNR